MERILDPQQLQQRHAHRMARIAALRQRIAAQASQPLDATEEHDLLHQCEEEKLARDVYLRLGERWGLRPFLHISGAEQAHLEVMQALLAHYGLPDPVRGLGMGEFHTPQLQALYDALLADGLRSELAAVQTGLHVEELDIDDLRKAGSRTRQPEIREVYAELERGSRNHLRAFFRHLQQYAGEYVPQHLSLSDFEAVAWSEHEPC
ncbi:DUF2202 domain-containing protein [Thiomonas sp.]|jgi:hypothetical protein|uniref:DUF2202 domain-containing protein n=1 Tax=Thiomonas sp. TaxID=2047785 RepID=UPI00262D563B|nr:DUF2202 domain-containing protein [Thiomonas sp.]